MKKILYIAVSSSTGGVPKHILEMLKYNHENALFEITVAVPNDGLYYEAFCKYASHMIEVPLKPYNFRSLGILKNYMITEGIDIVHSHGKGAGMYSRVLKLFRYKTKVVHTYHGIYLEQYGCLMKTVYKALERMLKHWTDVFVCVSESESMEAEGLRFNIKKRCYVIPNGIEPQLFAVGDCYDDQYFLEFGIKKDSCILGCVARLELMKGHRYLLEAYQKFRKKYEQSHLLLVGDGPDRSLIEAYIKKLGIEDNVTITGFREDIPELLHFFDLFISASLKEGMPYTLLEALAAKTAVVATNVIGNKDLIIDHYTGILAKAKDSDDLYQSMCYAKQHPDELKIWTMNGQKYIKEGFTVRQSACKLFAVYQQVLSDKYV